MFRSKSSIYALLAVFEIAKRHAGGEKAGVQAGHIAEMYGLPAAYAAKVMSQLARSKILRSERGPRGGFRLQRSADQITLMEVIDAVKGLEDAYREAIAARAAKGVRRGLADVFRKATMQIREALNAVTVAEFLRKWSGAAGR
jgi:Rrf2 family protein